MNQSACELAALGRIIRVIKRFYHLVPDSKMASEESKDIYLKQHLSRQDWKLWKQLQEESVELHENNQKPLVEKGLTRTQFNGLLSQYKRAGMESYQFWYQSQRQPDFGLGDSLSSCELIRSPRTIG